MSIQDAARAAVAQWRGRTVAGQDLPTVMVAIAGAESGWQPNALGDRMWGRDNGYHCNGYQSHGLWQVNIDAHFGLLRQFTGSDAPCSWAEWLFVPANAARAADAVIHGTGQHLPASALVPWTVWWSRDHGQTDAGDGNGRYLDYLAQATEAVAQVRGAGAPVPSPLPPPDDQPGPGTPGPILITTPGLFVPAVGVGALGLAAVAGFLVVGAWLLVGQDQ